MTEKLQVINYKLSFPRLLFVVLGFITVRSESLVTPDDIDASCPKNWVSLHRGCYKFTTTELSWQGAQEECREAHGELTMIQSVREKREIESYLAKHFSNTKKWWVGFYRKETTGTNYTWLDNRPVCTDLAQWRNSKLRYRSGCVCGLVEMLTTGIEKLHWSLTSCTKNNPFICEYQNISSTVSNSQGAGATITTSPSIDAIQHSKRHFGATITMPSLTRSPGHSTDSRVINRQNTDDTYDQDSREGVQRKEVRTSGAHAHTVTVPVEPTTITAPILSGAGATITTPPRRVAIKHSYDEVPANSETFRGNNGNIARGNTTRVSESEHSIPPAPAENTKTQTVSKFLSSWPTQLVHLSSTTSAETIRDRSNPGEKPRGDIRIEDLDETLTSSILPTTNDTKPTVSTTTRILPTRGATRPVTIQPTRISNDLSTYDASSAVTEDFSDEVTKNSATVGNGKPTATGWTKIRSRPSTAKSMKPNRLSPTSPTWARSVTPYQTKVNWGTAFEEFEGCYTPGTGGSLKELAMSAKRLYGDMSVCPAVKIGSISWSQTESGVIATAPCGKGDGFAKFECGGDKRVCWRGQPDITGCANKKLQEILEKTKVHKTDEENLTVAPASVEDLVMLSSQLVHVTATAVSAMEDVIVASHVLTALTRNRDQDPILEGDGEQFQEIVENVVEAGNNLLSCNKSAMWKEMSQNDRARSASSLLIALETATVSAAGKLDSPTVITHKNEHFELELQVVDLEKLERENKTEILYSSEQTQNTFSIPLETLRSSSKGDLARAVFITHCSLAKLLGGQKKRSKTSSSLEMESDQNIACDTVTEEKEEENTKDDDDQQGDEGPKLISYVLSASLEGGNSKTDLPKPVSFTIEHLEELDANYVPLCSFWNVSEETQFGFWSQNGCRLVSSNRSHTTCECDHMTNFAILLDVHGIEMTKIHKSLLRVATIIGCVISIVCLLASWVTFQCIASLQGERNSIHKNLAATLLLAEILFVFGIDQAQHRVLCSVIAAFLHYFFLAAFTWMFIEGLHIIFMLVQVFAASRSRLPFYYFVGYGFPLLVVVISCLVYNTGYGTEHYCWLTTEKYFIWAFAGPVAIILVVNAIFLAYGMTTVCKHSKYVFNKGQTGSGIRGWIQGAVALEVLLGLTWTLGFFMINDGSGSVALAYIFAIFNSLQGLFIFVFHCCLSKKAQKGYRSVARAVVTRTTSGGTSRSSNTKRPSHSQKIEDTRTNDQHELGISHTKSLPSSSSTHKIDEISVTQNHTYNQNNADHSVNENEACHINNTQKESLDSLSQAQHKDNHTDNHSQPEFSQTQNKENHSPIQHELNKGLADNLNEKGNPLNQDGTGNTLSQNDASNILNQCHGSPVASDQNQGSFTHNQD